LLRALVRRRVDVAASVDSGLERQQQRTQARRLGRSLENLPDRERTPLPRPLTGERGRHARAKIANRADPVAPCGETIGFRNAIVRYPQRRITVVVLTNRNDREPYRTALAIAKLFL